MSRRVFIFVGVANYAQVAEACARVLDTDIVIMQQEEKTQRVDPFAQEPIMIKALPKLDAHVYKYYEQQPSKFIDKPKNNYKKR